MAGLLSARTTPGRQITGKAEAKRCPERGQLHPTHSAKGIDCKANALLQDKLANKHHQVVSRTPTPRHLCVKRHHHGGLGRRHHAE